MKLSNKTFDFLKWMAMFFLPALATLVKVVFTIWNLPYGNEISATIVALNSFLGALLGISNIAYYKKEEES